MTSTLNIPANYQQVMPYLIVRHAEKFIDFMKAVFGAEELYKQMRDEKHIQHAELKLGESTIMFADSTEQYDVQNAGLFVYVEDADTTYRKALDAGATSVMQVADQPYGRSGGIKDPFGNTWWITSPKENA